MIQDIELKKNNWILNDNCLVQVVYLMESHVTVNTLQGSHINCQIKLIQPIPLTPEILERCGFTKAYESFHDGIVIMNLKVAIRLDFQWSSEYDKGMGVSNKGEDEALMFPCQSLHQLQNLYFALAGTELTFKP